MAGESSPPADLHAVFVNVDDPAVTEIRSLGEKAVAWAASSVADDAASSIVAFSPAGAVKYCHLKNLPASGPLLPDSPRITAIKLTSLRLRNPANAPDAAEKLALESMRADVEAKVALPRLLVQRIDHSNGTKEWRVYRPLIAVARCEACHGSTRWQSAELRDTLQARYPSDVAVDYTAGDWRGMASATVSDAPAARAVQITQEAQPTGKSAPTQR